MEFWIFVIFLNSIVAQLVQCTEKEGCFNTCMNATDTNDRCMYDRIGQKCYYRFHKRTNWEENRLLCVDRGLEMVRLSDETLPDVNKLRFKNKVDAYMWIGGKAESKTEWMFVNDTAAVSQTTMVVGFNDSSQLWHHCGFLDTENFSLKTDECKKTKPFLCRFGNDVAAYKEAMTWSRARGRCLLDGGDLFFLRKDPNELLFEEFTKLIKAEMAKSGIDQGKGLHIGVEHRSWHWLNGDPIVGSSTWLLDHYDQNCVDVDRSGLWHEYLCNHKLMAFCQKDLMFEKKADQNATLEKDKSSSTIPTTSVEIRSATHEVRKPPLENANFGISRPSSVDVGISTPPCVDAEAHKFTLRALIVTATLMGVFFLGCVILTGILIKKMTAGKRNKEAFSDTDGAKSEDRNTYTELNLAAMDKKFAKNG